MKKDELIVLSFEKYSGVTPIDLSPEMIEPHKRSQPSRELPGAALRGDSTVIRACGFCTFHWDTPEGAMNTTRKDVDRKVVKLTVWAKAWNDPNRTIACAEASAGYVRIILSSPEFERFQWLNFAEEARAFPELMVSIREHLLSEK
jgi:hypothetical protein